MRFGESTEAINHRRERMHRTGGAHAVYLAALEDPKLSGRLATSPSGALRYQSQPLGALGMASILVYLTGKYSIRPTEFELRCGLLSAAEKGEPTNSVLQEGRVERDRVLRRRIEAWIEENDDPSLFTTDEVAIDVVPQELEDNRRGTQMLVARVLTSLGYAKGRRQVGGKRQLVWVKPVDVEDDDVDVMMDKLPELKRTFGSTERPDEVPSVALGEEEPEEVLPDIVPEELIAAIEDEEVPDIDPLEAFDHAHSTPFDDHEDLEEAEDRPAQG